MTVHYRFSSEKGDLPADRATLGRPFLLGLSEPHPCLTLQDYFDAIRQVVLLFLPGLDPECAGKSIPETILIRSEKHGALYHVASAEVLIKGRSRKFAVSTAVTDTAKACLNREEILLRRLDQAFHLPYLPRVYFKKEVSVPGKQILSMLVTEWFEDCHEWHFTGAGCRMVSIWDRERGSRLATPSEVLGLYREISKILTLYYDPNTFCRIGPWHHAAGDFIIKTGEGKVHARLTTVRGYEPLKLFNPVAPVNPVIALVYFLLDLSLKMRLDRLDGTGEAIWVGDLCLKPILEGFFEGLRDMDCRGRYPLGKTQDLLALLRAFSNAEVQALLEPLLSLYRQEKDRDLPLIEANAGNHIKELCNIIRTFPG
jgi:hypothetical protein